MKNKSLVMGFVVSLISILIVLMILFFSGAFDKNFSVCTEEAKICPDGTVVERTGPNCEFEECPFNDLDKYFCDETSRNVDACIEIYEPVCGWFDSSKVQCINYPCAQDFSNSCFACSNSDVLYWTMGECPDTNSREIV